MKHTIYIVMTLCGLMLQSCDPETRKVIADSSITTKNLDITDYSKVSITGGFNLHLSFSETEESIKIEANSRLHDHIIATKENNKLSIRLKKDIDIKGQKTLDIYIVTKSISSISAIGNSQIRLEDPLVGDQAKIYISADSFLTGEVNVDRLYLDASADSDVNLYGSVNTFSAKLSADTRLSGYGLTVEHLIMKMSADCSANLTVTKSMDIEAVADCTMLYKGDPDIVNEKLEADSRLVQID